MQHRAGTVGALWYAVLLFACGLGGDFVASRIARVTQPHALGHSDYP